MINKHGRKEGKRRRRGVLYKTRTNANKKHETLCQATRSVRHLRYYYYCYYYYYGRYYPHPATTRQPQPKGEERVGSRRRKRKYPASETQSASLDRFAGHPHYRVPSQGDTQPAHAGSISKSAI